MQARFRIKTADGQELEPRTLEIFSEMVRSGVIRQQDQVYDALTEQWVEAGRHPMVRLFQDPLVTDSAPGGGDPALVLADVPGPSREEAEAAFIRRMEEERRSDPERVPLALELPVVTARHAGPSPAGEPAGVWADVEHEVPGPEPVAPSPERGRRTRPLSRRRGAALAALAGAAMVVLAGTAGLLALRAPASPTGTSGAAAASGPRGAGGEDAVRDGARAGFLRRAAGLRDPAGIEDVPAVWLEGTYLSDAVAYPGVREFWEGVRGFLDEVRSVEAELYREAWLEAADELGVSGPVRSLRLATALGDFAATSPVREAHYRRVGELAAAAVALHDVLVELGDRVTYEPIRGARLSADPVLEAAGADPAAQALLERALDRVLAALRGPEGDSLRDRARLAEWIVHVPL